MQSEIPRCVKCGKPPFFFGAATCSSVEALTAFEVAVTFGEVLVGAFMAADFIGAGVATAGSTSIPRSSSPNGEDSIDSGSGFVAATGAGRAARAGGWDAAGVGAGVA